MKKIEISGIAKIDGSKSVDSDYAKININGISIEKLLADNMLSKEALEGKSYIDETAICKVTIAIEPYAMSLIVDGREMELEL